MVQVSRIVCPVDFSEFSRRALDQATALARWYGARLTALYVYSVGLPPAAFAPGLASEPLTLSPQDRSRLMATLERFVATTDRGIPVECRLAEGAIPAGILDHVRAEATDLLVIGTHGRSGFEHLVLGSVTEKILRKAGCPVLTVPPAVATDSPSGPTIFQRILAAVDFSDASMRGLDYALSLAQESNAHLTVVHVVEAPWQFGDEWLGAAYSPTALEQGMNGLKERLARAIPEGARDWCRVAERVEVGRPYREILRLSNEDRSGLIVLGAHGHGVVDRMFFGSTAHHVVRQATCPVLTVRDTVPDSGAGSLTPR